MPNESSLLVGISESYLADLGRVIAAWSKVEQNFQILFLSIVVMRGKSSGSLLAERERVIGLMGQGLKRQLGDFRKRLEELELTDEKRRQFDRVLSRLDTLRNERDIVAHGQWHAVFGEDHQLDPSKSVAIIKSWKNLDDFEWKSVPQARLKEIFERIEALYWDLFDLSLDQELRAQKPLQP